MNAIASLAGVSKGNIFHHFASKQDLYIAVLKLACSRSSGKLDAAEAGDIELSFADLQPFLQQQLANMFEQPETTNLVLREVTFGEAGIEQALAQQVFSGHLNQLVKMLQNGIELGLIREDIDLEIVAFSLVSLNMQYFQTHSVIQHLTPKAFNSQPSQFNQQIFDLMLQGIAK